MCVVTPAWKEQLFALPGKGKNIIDGWRKLSGRKKLRQWAEVPGVVPGAISLVCLSTALQLTSQFQVVVDGHVLGAVKDKQAVISYVQELDSYNKQSYGSDVAMVNNLQLARSYGLPVQAAENLQIILQDRLSWGTEAAVITVNGQEVVALQDLSTAESVLNSIKENIAQQLSHRYAAVKNATVELAEKVEVVTKAVTVDRVIDPQTATDVLLQGKSQQTRYVVSRGDTLSRIAVSRGVSLSTITAANPDIQPTKLQIGQALNLTVPEPYIHVQETAEVIANKPIPYTTRYIQDSSLWNWQSVTVTPGKNGVQEVTSLVTTVNGKVTEEKVLAIKRVEEPVQAVVKQGTKQAAVQGTGNFIWPTNGALTSGYGWRWGSFHYAVDIGSSQGTPIYAADAGVVTYAGWKSSYGYLVEIDHGNGYVTRYGHCSKLLVSRGQRVSKGQTIAKVGQTGNATGPHVHFEILKNGSRVNPLKYFK
jgi:murein DD-endopeptidase MepM/ murein hydrolase activator NlpD